LDSNPPVRINSINICSLEFSVYYLVHHGLNLSTMGGNCPVWIQESSAEPPLSGVVAPIFLYGGPLILAGENGNAPHDYTPPLIDHCVVNFDANTSPRAARRDMIDRWEAHSNSSIDYPRVGGGSQEVCQRTWNSNQKEGSPCRRFSGCQSD
jgi:hypothetical protein